MLKKNKLRPIAVALASALALQGCATTPGQKIDSIKETFKETFNNDDPCANSKRNVGIAIGAIAGAIIATQVSGDKNKGLGVLIGLAAGGGLGALIGADIDKRACEISKIQKKYDASIQVTPINVNAAALTDPNKPGNTKTTTAIKEDAKPVGLSVSITDKQGKPQFESGSDVLTANTRDIFTDIARQYKSPAIDNKNEESALKSAEVIKARRILLIGHTDDTGSSSINASLSERRALNVAKLFKEMGIPDSQIFYQGAGETMPLADNATEEGRALNRRVEIVDLGNEDAFKLYLQNKRANTQFYRPVESNTVAITDKDEKPVKDPVAVEKPVTTKVVTKPIPTAPKPNKYRDPNAIDFGGSALTASNGVVDVGAQPVAKAKFSFINEAQASDMSKISTCSLDRPRDSGAVRSLNSGKEYATSKHMPGLDGRSWADNVGGNLVVLNDVAVLSDGITVPKSPNLKVYSNYNPSKNKNQKADIDIRPAVNVYQGRNGIIYRVFAKGDHGVQCMDLLMPHNSTGVSKAGKIVYGSKDNIQVADFSPKRLK